MVTERSQSSADRSSDPHRPTPPGRISGELSGTGSIDTASLRVDIIGPDGIVVDTQPIDRRNRYTSRLLFAGPYRVEVRGPKRRLLAAQDVEVRLGEITRCDFAVHRDAAGGASEDEA